MSVTYDVIVIGAGPGGYVAAIRAAQLGLKTAIIDKQKTLGGTCLNWGCIPSKALLDSSEHYHMAQTKFKIHGIDVKDLKLNFKQMMARKNDVVDTTTKGIEFLMSKHKITVIKGSARFVDATTVEVVNGKSKKMVKGANIMVATGSEVTPLPPVPFDGKRVIGSNEAVNLEKVPKHMVIIGAGVIGVELGSVYARLGAKVTFIEFLDGLIPTMDKELGKHLKRALKQYDMDFHFNTKVTGAKVGKNDVTVVAENKKGEKVTVKGDVCLVAIGRRPYTDGLGLDAIGVTLDKQGRIPINEYFQTSVPTVYAIGDVVAGPMLAHKASEEGSVCAEIIAGQKGHLNYLTIPGVVYTWPEVASVGYTEEQLKEQGRAYKKGSFPFKASGRARASEESDGFVKVLSDKDTDEILGVHMIGPRAADMISEALVAMEYRASAEDIGMMVHPHPTFSEAMKEASLAATDNRPIHI